MILGCIPLLHFHDKSLTGRQDACATEIDPFASMGCSLSYFQTMQSASAFLISLSLHFKPNIGRFAFGIERFKRFTHCEQMNKELQP
jgi:hypothetical protein